MAHATLTQSSFTGASLDPVNDSELLKIAQDILGGMKYSFVSAAARPDTAFPPGTIEESFRRAVLSRKPARKEVYRSKAAEIAAQPVVERRANFGRYGSHELVEYSQLGFHAASSNLAPVQLDDAKLVTQLKLLPVIKPAPQPPVVDPSAGPGFSPVSLPPLPTVKTVGFYIAQVHCLNETDPEIGTDDIALGGLAVDETGNTTKIGPLSISDKFTANKDSVVNYNYPGRLFCSFDTTKPTPWAKGFAAIVYIAEIDSGGFASFLTDAWHSAGPIIKQKIEDAFTAAGVFIGGVFGVPEIGAAIGAAVGKVVAWVADKIVGWIIDLFEDDLSIPGNAYVVLKSPQYEPFMAGPGWSHLATPVGQFDFKWAGGEYTVDCRWAVDLTGEIPVGERPPAASHYVGAFRGGSDGHALWVGNWNSFATKWLELSKGGLRLSNIDVFARGNSLFYSGVFRAGSDKYALWANVEWTQFEAKWKELSSAGHRLIDFKTYMDGSKRLYAGVFRAGTDAHSLWVGLDWPSFTAKWKSESERGLRLVSVSSYSDGGRNFFGGVFRAGTDGHALFSSDWPGFTKEWTKLSSGGLRLVSIDTFREGERQMFIGAFRPGTDGFILWNSDWNGFLAKWREASLQELRLVSLAAF